MTIAKDFAAKLAVAFVAVAMVLSAFAPSTQAQTTEELQAMINDLLAQVASLSGSTSDDSSSAAGVCPFTWTRDLSTGSTGADVKALQQFLNANADTRVAATGAGSMGMETETFGPMTAAAVSKFQVMHRADVLTPAGLVNPTGYFGPGTRAKANSLCTTAASTDDSDDSTDDSDDSDSEDAELSGEASLDSFEIESADEDELEEGAEDAPVAIGTFEFTDGDAEISRIDVSASSSAGNDEVDPWDVLETVSLWVDGEMIAEVDAADEDDYLDEDAGTLRFGGLDIVAMEDEEVEITVAATFQSNLDDVADGEGWEFAIETMRFFDADGVASTEDSGEDFGTAVAVTLDEAGFEDELIAKSSTSDPDAATLKVEDDSKSDWFTVFIFDLDTDDSVNDITINEMIVNVTTNGTVGANAGYNDLVDDAELVIDGTTIDDVTVGGTVNSEGPATLTFDVDGDAVIEAGERVSAELKLKFKSLPSGEEGATIEASISASDTTVDAEGADDLAGSQISGAATGEEHTLRTSGIEAAFEAAEADVTVVDESNNDYATFEIEVEVTAFDQDVFIPIGSASTTWKLVDGNGDDLVTSDTASTTVVITSSAEEGGAGNNFFEINEGETETVTVTVTYTPGQTAPVSARLQLLTFVFDETGTATKTDDSTWNALPANDYRTDTVTIQD